LPPASVGPAAALRVGGGGGQRRRARASASPPASARPAASVSGGEGRWCVAAGVGMAGGGFACWRGRRATEACTCYCSSAGVGKTGGERVGWGGALVCRRRRRYGRWRLCMLATAAGNGGVYVLLLRRRRWKDRRRTCRVGRGAGVSPPASVWPAAALRVGGGGGQRSRVRATAPPPALEGPAADVSGEEGRGCVAAGVDMACGGTWRRGLRVRKEQSCDWPAAGVGETGGGRVGRGRAQVCCRRCLYGRRWPLGGSGCRRRRYGRRRHCVLGVAGGQR